MPRFPSKQESDLCSCIELVEDVIGALGYVLDDSRLETQDATPAWLMQKGSVPSALHLSLSVFACWASRRCWIGTSPALQIVSGKPTAFFLASLSVRTMPSSKRNEEHWTCKQSVTAPAIGVASGGG